MCGISCRPTPETSAGPRYCAGDVGLDEFLEFRAAWMEPYDDWRYDVEKTLDAGVNRVVATFHQRGKLRDSDSWFEMHYGIVYTVEEGLIRRAEMYANARGGPRSRRAAE